MKINKKVIYEEIEDKYEMLFSTQDSVYAFGYDMDGYYCFEWDVDCNDIKNKHMFMSCSEYQNHIFELIEKSPTIKPGNSCFNLYECNSRYTIEKLRLELEHGHELMLTYGKNNETLEFSHNKTVHLICYTSKSVKKAVCQEFLNIDELLENGNINGEYLPELIEKFNQYVGKIGKDLFKEQ